MYTLTAIVNTATTEEAEDTTLSDPPELDVGRDGTEYVNLPSQGVLIGRTGTLITHAGYEVASVVIQLERANISYIAVDQLSNNKMADANYYYQLEIDALSYQYTKLYTCRNISSSRRNI